MKKAKKETPLRQLRFASGRTQKAFAAYLGLKFDLYHSLELGRAKLTLDKARSIAQKTGASPESLNPEVSRLALNIEGRPYTNDSWERWQNGRNLWPWQRVIDLLQWTEFLCKIAERQDKLLEICFELCDCLTKAKDKFDLGKIVRDELAHTEARMGFFCKRSDLRDNKELARQLHFDEAERDFPDDGVCGKVITYSPTWSPHSLLPPELANRFDLGCVMPTEKPKNHH